MKTVFSGQYGGWDPNPESEILNLLKKVYKEQNGVEGIVQVDHAGLECSVILGKYPGMDVVKSWSNSPQSTYSKGASLR